MAAAARERARLHSAPHADSRLRREVIVENLGDVRAGALCGKPPCNSALERGVELATMFDNTANKRASLRRLSDVAIDVAIHLMAGPVAHIFVLGWFQGRN